MTLRGKKQVPLREQAKNVQALKLRLTGASYEQVARELGYANAEAARVMVQQTIAAERRESVDELRPIEVKRLDRMYQRVERFVMDEDAKPQMVYNGVDRLLKIQERRAALLGLDKPKVVDLRAMIIHLGKVHGLTEEEALSALPDAQLLIQHFEAQASLPEAMAAGALLEGETC